MLDILLRHVCTAKMPVKIAVYTYHMSCKLSSRFLMRSDRDLYLTNPVPCSRDPVPLHPDPDP